MRGASGPAGCARASGVCHLLLEDVDLYESVPARLRDRAIQECVTREIALRPGVWSARDAEQTAGEGVGLLILDGLLLRRVGVDGRFGAELLGAGDLMRPWHATESSPRPTLPLSTSRTLLTSARIAVLDLDFAATVTRYPQIAAELVDRALRRSRNLAVLMAIVHHPRIDVRLHTLFWHLAARWGQTLADGALLALPLKHSQLADMVAARRPTVSSALATLASSGLVVPTRQGWRLRGAPAGELDDICPPIGEPAPAAAPALAG